jgi:SagB-type dehydrogenase family enzyme
LARQIRRWIWEGLLSPAKQSCRNKKSLVAVFQGDGLRPSRRVELDCFLGGHEIAGEHCHLDIALIDYRCLQGDLFDMIKSCLDFHEVTSYYRDRMGGHYLDWANQPKVYKTYDGIKPLPLDREAEFPREKLHSLLLDQTPGDTAPGIDLAALSKLFLLSYTFTTRARSQEGEFYFRSAASAGALYPTEVYTATRGVAGLHDGLYHYAIQAHALVPLRNGELGPYILQAAGREEKTLPVVILFLTAIYFRSAWKYRARSYRYHLLDTGHVEENLILALKSLGLPYQVSYDFDDAKVNDLLGLDEKMEVALALVFLFGQDVTPRHNKQEILQLSESVSKASRVSRKEVDYPAVREIHDAGKERIAGRIGGVEMTGSLGLRPKEWMAVESPSVRNETADYPDCVFMRRSRRNFVKRLIREDAMAEFLKGVSASDRNPYEGSVSVGFLTAQVEGVESGFHLLDREKQATGMIAAGSYIESMAPICLDQAWLANAGVHFLFLANLKVLDRTWGPRGYRYAMMTAGRLGERLYIAATARGLGCCGIGAFYDGEARKLLGLNESSRLLYLVAVGVVKKNQ